MTAGPTLGVRVEQAAQGLATRRIGVVVGAIANGATEVGGAGRLDRGRETAPDAATVFEIGSVTKVFTSLALARMAVTGAVGLDEPLRALLPAGTSVPSRGGVEITLRHLATHTSGLPRLPQGMLRTALLHPRMPDPYAGCTSDVLLEGLARTTLRAIPGQRLRYSNLGAGLLGLALANRAGTDYETLIVTNVCDLLELPDTRIALNEDQRNRFAQGHNRAGRAVAPWNLADLAGAGGLRSTVTDLLALALAQINPEASALADAIALSREVRYGRSDRSWIHLGWMGVRLHPRQGAHTILWHNGATGGYFACIGFAPAERAAVVVLTNSARSVDAAALDLLRSILAAEGQPGARR